MIAPEAWFGGVTAELREELVLGAPRIGPLVVVVASTHSIPFLPWALVSPAVLPLWGQMKTYERVPQRAWHTQQVLNECKVANHKKR